MKPLLSYKQTLTTQNTEIKIYLHPGTYSYSLYNNKMNSSGKIIFE